MSDKTTLGISDLLRQFIEALVKEVVLEGKPFDDQKKKWLQTYSQEEGVDYALLEKNFTDFFEVMEEWKQHGLKSSELMAKMLAKKCYISESEMEKLFSTPRQAREPRMLDGHEYVDLGLPSGTLWATCNIGATKPEEYGGYFAWGETRPKSVYDWDSYKYSDGSVPIKYTAKDRLKALQSMDDAATANWGEEWRMPTKEEWEELINCTTNIWTALNGVNGRLITASNGNSIFFPAAGCYSGNEFGETIGCYWLNLLRFDYPNAAWDISFGMEYCVTDSIIRHFGLSIRPVHSNSSKDTTFFSPENSREESDHYVYSEEERAKLKAARKQKKEAERRKKEKAKRAQLPLKIDNGIVYCTNKKYQGELVVPNVLDNQTVLAIGNEAFLDCNDMTSLIIPDTVAVIGAKACKGCGNLRKVVIPNSVTTIDDEAFRSCSSLASIIIPNSVTSIGNEAFRACFLKHTSIVIPDSVTYLGQGAFRGCKGLSSVSISNALTVIEYETFMNCGLTEVKIPESVKTIGGDAFLNCDSMLSLFIPDSVDSIADNAFYGCDNLEDVTVGRENYKKLKNIPSSAQIHLIRIKNNAADGYLDEEETAHRSGEYQPFIVNGAQFNMIKIDGGTVQMGNNPVHSKILSDYYLGETVVTQLLWKAVMGTNPSGFKGDNLPVDSVSWEDCQGFISKLNRITGKSFRLPTEAEWEYAAKGGIYGKGRKYAGSNDINKVAWFEDNSSNTPHAVKIKQSNELGLYDMNGNVWEWCEDWYWEYDNSSHFNREGPSKGFGRVMRGGAWNSQAFACKVSSRFSNKPENKSFLNGFRLCLSE